jgi:hypothetical protein
VRSLCRGLCGGSGHSSLWLAAQARQFRGKSSRAKTNLGQRLEASFVRTFSPPFSHIALTTTCQTHALLTETVETRNLFGEPDIPTTTSLQVGSTTATLRIAKNGRNSGF